MKHFDDAKLRNNQLRPKNYSQGCEQVLLQGGNGVALYLRHLTLVPSPKEEGGQA